MPSWGRSPHEHTAVVLGVRELHARCVRLEVDPVVADVPADQVRTKVSRVLKVNELHGPWGKWMLGAVGAAKSELPENTSAPKTSWAFRCDSMAFIAAAGSIPAPRRSENFARATGWMVLEEVSTLGTSMPMIRTVPALVSIVSPSMTLTTLAWVVFPPPSRSCDSGGVPLCHHSPATRPAASTPAAPPAAERRFWLYGDTHVPLR